MNISIVKTQTAFDQLKEEWSALHLACKSQSPFLSWEWMNSWWKHYSKKIELSPQLSIIVSRDKKGDLCSIWPLFIDHLSTSFGHIKVLKFIGTTFESSDYLDIICRNDITKSDFKAILNSKEFINIVSKIDKIIFKNILQDSVIFKYKSCFKYLKWHRINAICPYLTLPADKEEFLGSVSRNMRSSLKRTYNKLHKDPDTKLTIIENQNDIDLAIENLFRLHGNRFDDKNADTNFLFEERGDFHQEIAKIFFSKKWLRFYEIFYKNEVIGSLYCYLYSNKLMYFQAGFNPDYSEYAIGNQLILHAIYDSIDLKCTEFDFMRGNEAYKYKWTSKERFLFTLEIGCSAKGKILLTKKTLSKNIKKNLKKVLFVS